ncbi:hypothetical protein PGN35_001605 [Nodosilinea sp. PGN35]|uniref:hypothetical protein n=1 Tax=Nodosilinea sp. PGN35 TaxID=3020489 RepID=UPI0023B29E66|nr:hypothetical protein [Nodosilinea sp. TSF1-S3]MDF0368897.1 hypothetical protein [Nodosilinea sp. TSF1-S3]
MAGLKRLKTAGVALGAIALALGASPALAEQRLAAETAPVEAPAAIATTPYSYENLFSIAFPQGWQVSEPAEGPQVVAVSPGANGDLPAMRTEVIWQEAPPREVVGTSLQAIQTKGYTVTRYDAANIDGVTAVRLWMSEIPDGLPNAFVTYVGYPEATATITTYYGDTETNIDPILDVIHRSFARSR